VSYAEAQHWARAMAAPIWLIAEREIRTYVATASFWAALALGPLCAAGALFYSATTNLPVPVAVHASSLALANAAQASLSEAGRLEHRAYSFRSKGAVLTLSQSQPALVEIAFADGFPLSVEGRKLVALTIERDAARGIAGPSSVSVRETSASDPQKGTIRAVPRFSLVMLLWLTLTGSLGMLLQAVVRERASRSLESLLSVARPWEIMLGKLAGVGAISFLVLAAWFGAVVAMSSLAPPSPGDLVSTTLTYLAKPAVIIRATATYLLAYAFYGSITITLGAMARDSATAQNLSRPLFIVLLAAFFVSLTSMSGPATPWLVYLPPLTPFLVLLFQDGALAPTHEALLFAEMLAAAIAAGLLAGASLSITPGLPGLVRKLAWTLPSRSARSS
jgi:ABC-2 type transport system permease protein